MLGQQYPTTTIHQIKNKFNQTIYSNSSKSKQVISAEGAYLISDILSDNKTRYYMFGTSLNIGNKKVAVKTGTTDDNRDALTIGYTPDIAIGVWVGNNNNAIMQAGGEVMAGPIWRKTMEYATKDKNSSFYEPNDIVEKYVCHSNGGLSSKGTSGTYQEKFIASHLPADCDTDSSSVNQNNNSSNNSNNDQTTNTVNNSVNIQNTSNSVDTNTSSTSSSNSSVINNENNSTNNTTIENSGSGSLDNTSSQTNTSKNGGE